MPTGGRSKPSLPNPRAAPRLARDLQGQLDDLGTRLDRYTVESHFFDGDTRLLGRVQRQTLEAGFTIEPTSPFVELVALTAVTSDAVAALRQGSLGQHIILENLGPAAVIIKHDAKTKLFAAADKTLGPYDTLALRWDGTWWVQYAGTVAITGPLGGAPADASYITMSSSAALGNERVLTAGTGLNLVDSGGNGAVTLSVTNIPESALPPRAPWSVMGRAPNTGGAFADIIATVPGTVLRPENGVLGFGPLDLSNTNTFVGVLPPQAGGLPGGGTESDVLTIVNGDPTWAPVQTAGGTQDVLWTGTDAPTDPTIELWADTDEVCQPVMGPPGGLTGDVLTKASDADHDVIWATPPPSGGASGLGQWDWSTQIVSPATSNQIRANVAHPYTSLTTLWIRYHTTDGTDMRLMLLNLNVNDRIYIQDKNDSTLYLGVRITSAPVDDAPNGQVVMPVTLVGAGGALLNNQNVILLHATAPAPTLSITGTPPIQVSGSNVSLGPLPNNTYLQGYAVNGSTPIDIIGVIPIEGGVYESIVIAPTVPITVIGNPGGQVVVDTYLRVENGMLVNGYVNFTTPLAVSHGGTGLGLIEADGYVLTVDSTKPSSTKWAPPTMLILPNDTSVQSYQVNGTTISDIIKLDAKNQVRIEPPTTNLGTVDPDDRPVLHVRGDILAEPFLYKNGSSYAQVVIWNDGSQGGTTRNANLYLRAPGVVAIQLARPAPTDAGKTSMGWWQQIHSNGSFIIGASSDENLYALSLNSGRGVFTGGSLQIPHASWLQTVRKDGSTGQHLASIGSANEIHFGYQGAGNMYLGMGVAGDIHLGSSRTGGSTYLHGSTILDKGVWLYWGGVYAIAVGGGTDDALYIGGNCSSIQISKPTNFAGDLGVNNWNSIVRARNASRGFIRCDTTNPGGTASGYGYSSVVRINVGVIEVYWYNNVEVTVAVNEYGNLSCRAERLNGTNVRYHVFDVNGNYQEGWVNAVAFA